MTSADRAVLPRIATLTDTDAIVATISTAFFRDPLWAPVFPDEQQRIAQAEVMWRLHIASALRYPWMLVTANVEAAAVWIPPSGTELTEQEENGLDDLLTRAAGQESSQAILDIYDQLEAAHPFEPCFYLSSLGVHDNYRGKGLGWACWPRAPCASTLSALPPVWNHPTP
jgi:ribosomal protein S18 acetylase RimI-like enzyme